MRPAVIAALAADPAVAGIVGARVYGREGFTGGVSVEGTPEAFTADGDLLPSLVVWLELRRAIPGGGDAGGFLPAQQTIAVAALHQGPGYAELRALQRAVKRRLHGAQHRPGERLEAEDEPVRWTDIRWSDDSAELLDPELQVPMLIARFAAVIAENLEEA